MKGYRRSPVHFPSWSRPQVAGELDSDINTRALIKLCVTGRPTDKATYRMKCMLLENNDGKGERKVKKEKDNLSWEWFTPKGWYVHVESHYWKIINLIIHQSTKNSGQWRIVIHVGWWVNLISALRNAKDFAIQTLRTRLKTMKSQQRLEQTFDEVARKTEATKAI